MVHVSHVAPAVSVLLAFPHARMRSALAALLSHEPDLAVVASVGDAAAAGMALRRYGADVVVSDLSLISVGDGLLDGWGLIPAGVPVVVASFEGSSAMEARLREHGAAAYVSKEHLVERLPEVLRNVAATRAPLAAGT